MPIDTATDAFFRLHLDHTIQQRHMHTLLFSRMPWQRSEASMAHLFSGKIRFGKKILDIDLFGEQFPIFALKFDAVRPRALLRTMIALLGLKHAFNESDGDVTHCWSETQVCQFVGGRVYFNHTLPCGATTLGKFRALFGEDDLGNAGPDHHGGGEHETHSCQRHRHRRSGLHHATQGHLAAHRLEVAGNSTKEVGVPANDADIGVKQTFAKGGLLWRFKAWRSAHAKQFKRKHSSCHVARTDERSINTFVLTTTAYNQPHTNQMKILSTGAERHWKFDK